MTGVFSPLNFFEIEKTNSIKFVQKLFKSLDFENSLILVLQKSREHEQQNLHRFDAFKSWCLHFVGALSTIRKYTHNANNETSNHNDVFNEYNLSVGKF